MEITFPQSSDVCDAPLPYEYAVAERWWALPTGIRLPLTNGDSCYLLFAGRPGGSAGPDVQDAVLYMESAGQELVGDVEFHVRSSAWVAHQHNTDVRYNNVLLHVVLLCDDPLPTTRQDGTIIPTCSLYDLPAVSVAQPASAIRRETGKEHTTWPCQHIMPQLSDQERFQLLKRAGLLRFEQKTHAFVEQLHTLAPDSENDAYDSCLLPALAEGLGYGRDRAFFRAAGLRLLGHDDAVPEPLGRGPDPAPLDAKRFRVLQRIAQEWRAPGVWFIIRNVIEDEPSLSLQALQALFRSAELTLARADILICNVVLPFAAAVALLEHDEALFAHAQTVYEIHPGLSANRITRTMCAQLQLAALPQGSCQQQGLHYIYQQTCREKRCAVCIAGRPKLSTTPS